MMTTPRGLTADEAEVWARVAETVTPLEQRTPPASPKEPGVPPPIKGRKATAAAKPPVRATPVRPAEGGQAVLRSAGLDSHWDRRFKSGTIEPDFTLDLHGADLDAAYGRLMRGMAQARAMGARTVLVIAGKPRPVDPADRGIRRGAIRAKLLDWLAASDHAEAISAIRKAHRSHGGEGALYVVLRKG